MAVNVLAATGERRTTLETLNQVNRSTAKPEEEISIKHFDQSAYLPSLISLCGLHGEALGP